MFDVPSYNLPSKNFDFARLPEVNIARSKFRRPCGTKTTFDAGKLYPIYLDEVIPGDTFQMNVSHLVRMLTPLRPIMDNIYLDLHFFFVPYRLVWDNWVKMMGERKNPGDSIDYLVPSLIPGENLTVDSLAAYFGLPLNYDQDGVISALPFRAYNLIWNEWYRDENLQPALIVKKDDTADYLFSYQIQHRNKRHDYFTSCLPWPQKGAAVDLPLGQTAPVIGDGKVLGLMNGSGTFVGLGTGTLRTGVELNLYGRTLPYVTGTEAFNLGGLGVTSDPAKSGLIADLTAATAATINSFREALMVQSLLERDARSGTRYVELIYSHFGVVCPDYRLQRPEYLGGGTSVVNIDPVPNTSIQSATQQTFLGSVGYSQGTEVSWTKSFTEHGLIMGLVSVRADLNYQQGIHKMFTRQSRYDYYWPSLAHLGEQAVLKRELYADGSSVDDEVFGYQERWAEYRYGRSIVTGTLNSMYASSLDSWHLAQKFTSHPSLNSAFIRENPPISRVVAVASPQFIGDFYFDLVCTRPMPLYSVPGLTGHF